MSHFSMETELKEYLFQMNKAMEEDKLLVFDYCNRSMEYAERTVEPVQIAFSSGQWYLVAFCRYRNDYRRFKLVRIRNLKMGDRFEKRDISKEEIEKIFEDGYHRRSIQVTLKFTERIGEQLTEHFHKDTIKKTEDNQFIVVDHFPHEDGLIRFILSFGKECEVVEPRYLREELKEYVKELLYSVVNRGEIMIKQQLSDGIILYTFSPDPDRHFGYNITALIDENKAILIDTAYEEQAREVYHDLVDNGITIESIIISHFHDDHIYGLKALPKVPIYGSVHYQTTLDMWTKKEEHHYFIPTVLVEDSLPIHFGKHNLTLSLFPGHSHCGMLVNINNQYVHIGDELLFSNNSEPLLPSIDFNRFVERH